MSSQKRLGRSVVAVIAGLVATFVLSLGVDGLLHASGIFPPWGQPMSDALFVVATSYRLVFNAFGCYLAARLAPRLPLRHAMILGGVGFAFSLAATVGTWNKGPEFGPHWYPVLLIATALPCAWIGGRLGSSSGEAVAA